MFILVPSRIGCSLRVSNSQLLVFELLAHFTAMPLLCCEEHCFVLYFKKKGKKNCFQQRFDFLSIPNKLIALAAYSLVYGSFSRNALNFFFTSIMTQPPDEPASLSSVSQEPDDDYFSKLIPPISRGELFRDTLLRHLDHPFFQILGLLVILLVIIDGAFFFFLLVGWHGMCQPRMDCEPRNWWYNASIQILNVLFTYMAVISMPWRSTHVLHITGASCPHRSNAVGHDLYGIVNQNDAWFHIPLPKRLGIILLLLLNCVTQFANQITRIVYHSFELQNTFPGNIWTNVFFAASFVAAGMAGAWLAYEVHRLRRAHPGQFGPGPKEVCYTFYDDYLARYFGERTNPEILDVQEEEQVTRRRNSIDPTRDPERRSILPVERTSMRMFAM
jgi:hypothetical protein